VGGASVERRSATGAVGETRENEVGVDAAGVVDVARFYIFTLCKSLLDKLNLIPQGFFYYGFAVVFQGDTTIDKGSVIERIAPKCGV